MGRLKCVHDYENLTLLPARGRHFMILLKVAKQLENKRKLERYKIPNIPCL